MKNLLSVLVVILFFSCNNSPSKTIEVADFTSHLGLEELYKSDQADRQTANIDWSIVSPRDKQRRERVSELLDSNKVITSDDYANAAMVFQHGQDTTASGMAVKLMQKAVDLDPTRSKWLLAAATDRHLMRTDKPQIYGTQFTKMGEDEPWKMHEIDSTKVTDEQRREYGVETLAEQREKMRMMNKKKLNELVESGENIDDIIERIKKGDSEISEYNLSKGGINSFGYQLMSASKDKDALKVFKLYTELHPEDYNAYDSYGECFVKLGQLENGIIAYKKSFELNPKNKNAEKVLKELEEKIILEKLILSH